VYTHTHTHTHTHTYISPCVYDCVHTFYHYCAYIIVLQFYVSFTKKNCGEHSAIWIDNSQSIDSNCTLHIIYYLASKLMLNRPGERLHPRLTPTVTSNHTDSSPSALTVNQHRIIYKWIICPKSKTKGRQHISGRASTLWRQSALAASNALHRIPAEDKKVRGWPKKT